ncbi:hypothetical protein IV203_019874 [Nitzschia inconspicua]|uniref:Uncharacterized protein n=1 Tax=Nitzschia inconspicua TaxID=303405 RepID=A0A9K3M031_9STRA|nr:hypothetical protein IV203_019874 [Nitzschia inconspicua]
MSLWDSIQVGAKKAGDAAATKAKIGKLKADIVLLQREITNRQRAFGVTLYDHVSPLSQSQDFYAASDELTNLLRPPLIVAQKEIQALAAKKVKLKEALAAAEANRAAAFPTKAETVGQKFMNFGKASYLHGGETKIKGELALVDRSIKGHKQKFGIALFALLADAEDNKGYLPTDRQVRNIYDTSRSDVTRIEAKINQKDEEIVALGGKSTKGQGFSAAQDNNNNSTTTETNSGTFEPPNGPMMTSSSTNAGFSDTPRGGFSDNPNGSSSGQQLFTDPNDLLL